MKKLIYFLLLIPCLSQSSCTMVIKGIAKGVINKYDDHKDLNVSSFQLADKSGELHSFSDLYAGKTVYFYIWADPSNRPPGEKDENYVALKNRFAKYPDVVFADISIAKDQQNWAADQQSPTGKNSLFLTRNSASEPFIAALKNSTMVPFIVGKDGKMLAFKGPKPQDKLVVDYILYEAREGVNGTVSGKKLVRGVNSNQRFKTKALRNWYTDHFNARPEDKLSFGISSSE